MSVEVSATITDYLTNLLRREIIKKLYNNELTDDQVTNKLSDGNSFVEYFINGEWTSND